MREYARVSPATWTDRFGVVRKTPQTASGRRLQFKIPLHRALRAFVFERDNYQCRRCGGAAENVPADYDGRWAIPVRKGFCLVLDHIVSQRNGGSNHPSNLQTLCDSCNARKAGLEDAVYGVARCG